MRPFLAFALMGLLGAAVGCDDKESDAPPPPSLGGGATGAVGTDSGRPPPDDDEDAGDPGEGDSGTGDSGVLPYECRNVPVVEVPVEELPPGTEASTTSPSDFEVSRLVGSWQGGCDEPMFMVQLSEGDCPNGRDHALTFMIEAASLRDGSLRLGLNTIAPEPNDAGVVVRYVRPSPLTPAGEWGSCTGATGLIDLLGSAPATSEGSTLQATFTLELTACDDSDAPTQAVNGTFDVMVRRSLADYCPDI